MYVRITPARAAKVLTAAALVITIIGIVGQIFKHEFGNDFLFGLVPLFDLSEDSAVPTWYASITLFACSLLLGFIANSKRQEGEKYVFSWAFLSLIFLLMSVDEVARIHETIGELAASKLGAEKSGIFHYFWVVPGALFVLVVGLGYLNFVRNLPRRTAVLFVASGAIYVGGALIVEMINSRAAYLNPAGSLRQSLMTAFEESLEMAGIVLFIYALLSFISEQMPHASELTFAFGERPEESPAAEPSARA